MRTDRNGLEILSAEECFALLETAPVGRVAFCTHAVPLVFPVNFVVVDGEVVFRTGTGSKLGAAVGQSVMAFQADGVDPAAHWGWSVLVTGVATLVTHPRDLARLEGRGLQSWVPSRRSHTVRMTNATVSGRRLVG
ncbi:MAG: pyridoxamine 5'-phosphate oxidase family protein [Acidimicrobiales bacterium]